MDEKIIKEAIEKLRIGSSKKTYAEIWASYCTLHSLRGSNFDLEKTRTKLANLLLIPSTLTLSGREPNTYYSTPVFETIDLCEKIYSNAINLNNLSVFRCSFSLTLTKNLKRHREECLDSLADLLHSKGFSNPQNTGKPKIAARFQSAEGRKLSVEMVCFLDEKAPEYGRKYLTDFSMEKEGA